MQEEESGRSGGEKETGQFRGRRKKSILLSGIKKEGFGSVLKQSLGQEETRRDRRTSTERMTSLTSAIRKYRQVEGRIVYSLDILPIQKDDLEVCDSR